MSDMRVCATVCHQEAWTDGPSLSLDVATTTTVRTPCGDLTLSVRPWRRGAILAPRLDVARPLSSVAALGVRLSGGLGNRLLCDGYQSWDWAGLRDIRIPGSGWWGGVLGGPGATPCAVRLLAPPRQGALRLTWDGDGSLRACTVGEPSARAEGTGGPSALTVSPPAGRLVADPLVVMPGSPSPGCGLPRPRGQRRATGARPTGWMSWNCLGNRVSANAVRRAATDMVLPGGLVLVDDGWMPRWGNWRARDDFGSSIAALAAALHQHDRQIGLWCAPFLVDPALSTPLPVLRTHNGAPVVDVVAGRPHHVLDASTPAVRRHLFALGQRMASWHVDALKLDFLYAGALPGRRQSAIAGSLALRAGLAALCAGFRAGSPSRLVLGCGAPGPVVAGLLDSCRSGGDAVLDVPTVTNDAPLFTRTATMIAAQERNALARLLLWGPRLPCDVDAVSWHTPGGPRGETELGRRHLALALASPGPLLLSDHHRCLSSEQDRVLLLSGA